MGRPTAQTYANAVREENAAKDAAFAAEEHYTTTRILRQSVWREFSHGTKDAPPAARGIHLVDKGDAVIVGKGDYPDLFKLLDPSVVASV